MIESHLRIHFGKSQVAICLIQTAIPRIYEPKSTHVTIFKIVYDVMKVNKKQLFFNKFYFAKHKPFMNNADLRDISQDRFIHIVSLNPHEIVV